MDTVIQETLRGHHDRHRRWKRLERADRVTQYGDCRVHGLSPRQAAQVLDVPRRTRQAWRVYQERLDECAAVVAFVHSIPGLACLHRLVLAIHLVCVEVGACGMRLVCLLLRLTRLDRFVAAAYGAQQQVNLQAAHAIVDSRHTATARLAKDMPRKAITVPQDATWTGGLCVVALEPVSHCMLLAQRAQSRDQDSWQALMAPALAPLNADVMHATSDEAPGLLASVEQHRGVHPSPAVFHVQHALRKAVCAPLATKERAAAKTLSEAKARLEQVQGRLASAGAQPQARARPPPTSPDEPCTSPASP